MSASRDERIAHAVTARETGDMERARELLLGLRTEFPDDAEVAAQTAWVHDSMGYEEEAVEHYEAAIAGELSDQDLRAALLGFGSTLRALGRDADSERILRQGIERFPDFRPFRVFLALTEYNRGHARAAVRGLIEVLLETTSDPAIQRYRRSLAAYAEDLDRSWLGSAT